MISIVIPVYNDSNGLYATLYSIVKIDYQKNDYEIIIVDNGSSDQTLKVSGIFKKRHPGLIKILQEKSIQSSYAARNKGVMLARGSIIIFIDSDMHVDHDWLKKIKNSMEENKVDYLAYNVKMVLKNRNIFSLYNAATGFPVCKYINKENFAPTCCLAVKSIVFKKAGLFDSRLISGGDNEFGKRVNSMGFRQYYDPGINVYHPADISFSKSMKRWFRSGRGSFQKYHFHNNYYNHLYLNIFNPYHYMLPRPSKFLEIVRENDTWKNIKNSTRLCLYFIQWIVKIIRTIGYAYEKTRI